MTGSIVVETVATLVGIFIGTLAALVIDRRNERRRLRRRARIVLRSLAQELDENFKTIQKAKPAYASTPWGKSFYISTVAWETALAGGDLPAIIGFELTETISAQYALLMRIRYYVDLLTQLWFAPPDVSGHEEMRHGFTRSIRETMSQVLSRHTGMMGQIQKAHQAV
jgi:hypothetical protein